MLNLIQINQGEKCRVTEIQGGRMFIGKLDSLGIRPGVELIKLSAQLMRGPIIVKVGSARVAIGYRMAKRIIVEK